MLEDLQETGTTHGSDCGWFQSNNMSWQSADIHIPHYHRPTQGDTLPSLLFNLLQEAVINKIEIRRHTEIQITQILAYTDNVANISRNNCE